MKAFFVGIIALAALAFAQPPRPGPSVLPNAEINRTCSRAVELMDSGGVSMPELSRAAAPLLENARAACLQLILKPGRSGPNSQLLENVRAYLTLFDALPKPFPFSDTAQQQFAELRTLATRVDLHLRGVIDLNDRRLSNPDPANLARYAEANRRLGNPAPGKPRVVFFGDSITDFWRLNEYFPDNDYVNRGIAGQTSGELLQRFESDVAALKPQAVLIMIGTNDLDRGIPLEAIESNYRMLADLAEAARIKPIFASVTAVSDYHKDQNPSFERTPSRPPASLLALNAYLQKFTKDRGYQYVNYYAPLADEQDRLKADLGDDGLHPNAMGYRLMAPLAAAAIQKTLAPAPPSAEQPAAPKRRFPFGR
jgi:lysophospholipase L1-like esterase